MKSLLRHSGHLLMMLAIFAAAYLAGTRRSDDAPPARQLSQTAGENTAPTADAAPLPVRTGRLIV